MAKKSKDVVESKLKKNNNNLVLVSNDDDWEGLYVNGKKVFSHHHVDQDLISEWSAKLQMKLIRKSCTPKYTNWMQNEGPGDFPENLSEIPIED